MQNATKAKAVGISLWLLFAVYQEKIDDNTGFYSGEIQSGVSSLGTAGCLETGLVVGQKRGHGGAEKNLLWACDWPLLRGS